MVLTASRPYFGPTKLVLAFDIGLTSSRVSYCIPCQGQVPKIVEVTRFLGQEEMRGLSDVPSLLCYDKSGNVRAAGAEVHSDDVADAAEREGWTKVELWKLHLAPKDSTCCVSSENDLPPLPPGKSAIGAQADFVRYLFQCAKTYILAHHVAFAWSDIEDTIEYIFTHPSDWGGIQRLKYLRAILDVGLIPSTPEGTSRVHMMTESETTLHFCAASLGTYKNDQSIPQGVVIIDAGDIAIHLHTFSMATNPISGDEVAPVECMREGLASITHRISVLLQHRLEGWEGLDDGDIAEFTRKFGKTIKFMIKSDAEPVYLKIGDHRVHNSRYNISHGQLKFSGKEATGLLNESIDAIIDAFERQQKVVTIPVTLAFLVGELSVNDWVWNRLQSYFAAKNIVIWRSNNRTNMAVPHGAILTQVDRDNHHAASEGACTTHGVMCSHPVEENYEGDIRRNTVVQESKIQVDDDVLDLWRHDRPENAEAWLIARDLPNNPSHYMFAIRALMRTRLQEWDAALEDAEQSINNQPSVIGYIAKSVALIGKGKRDEGYRTCDIALLHFHSTRLSSFLLVKAVIIFMSGEHQDAISRVDDLMATAPPNCICSTVQAHMYLLHGDSQMESDYDSAIQSFERARLRVQHHDSKALEMISMISGWKFDFLHIKVGQRLCEALLTVGRVREAAESFNDVRGAFDADACASTAIKEWISDFQRRCCVKLEHFGDEAMDAQKHEEAISWYSAALSLDPKSSRLFIRRSKVYVSKTLWAEALNDANEAIAQDPSSPWGYEAKHRALHGEEKYTDAVQALETMLSKMAQSPDPEMRENCSRYISPTTTRAKIRKIIQRTLRRSPRTLINTATGRLQSRAEQASTFESSPVYEEILSSMTTRISSSRIKYEVKRFFRYVMLSHKWEVNEPLFHQVVHMSVYELDESSTTHEKLQTFCAIVREAGFSWAWSDTCCIDKQDHFVLQEALVAMFKWYRNSTLVIVYLRGVPHPAKLGDLVNSLWNTRAWTFQEYVAGKVVHFYTEDWKPYLDLKVLDPKESRTGQAAGPSSGGPASPRPEPQLLNHKESSEVIAEMEQATGVSSQRLMSLRPGFSNIREKLCLASTRETTLIEDAAYSLLGIFAVTGIPAIYGEGEGALGRLLAHLLSGSGDASILAWTGQSSSVNSCLPARIAVYKTPATSHLPLSIEVADMEKTLVTLRHSSLDLDTTLRLYDRINDLPTAWFAANRMKLPCIAFKIPSFAHHQTRAGRVYRTETAAFGPVEIKTKRWDLARPEPLYLVHPWMDALLGREDTHVSLSPGDIAQQPWSTGGEEYTDAEDIGDDDTEDEDEDEDDGENSDNATLFSEPKLPIPTAPLETDPKRRGTLALQLIARLRQPFGALLFMPASMRGREEYRRVAADCMITVQIQESVPMEALIENVRILDVL